MLLGQHYVITGVSRLSVRLATMLTGRGATVTIVGDPQDEQLGLLPDDIEVLPAGADRRAVLQRARVDAATCVLAVSADDLDNLRTAVACASEAPDVPVVVRTFDDSLADEIETGLNVRRAFSASALAAPSFVALVFGEEVLETLRLGETEVPICRLRVRTDSSFSGLTAAEVERDRGCIVLAVGTDDGWATARSADMLHPGSDVVVGGPFAAVLELAAANHPLRHDGASRSRRLSPLALRRRLNGPRQPTLLPYIGMALVLLLGIGSIVFGITRDLGPIDALYFTLTTAWGDPSLGDESAAIELFGIALIIGLGAIIGVFFSHLASVATAERLTSRMTRTAQRREGHVVIAGLGKVGYRIATLCDELAIPAVVVEREPDTRFVTAVSSHTPVLSGDVRLPEMLELAGVARAAVMLACTDDDLANVSACLQARRLNPSIRTVARIFDDTLAENLGSAFAIDAVLSSSEAASHAFFGAATDHRATRVVEIGDLEIAATRLTVDHELAEASIAAWHRDGARFLAYRRGDQPVVAVTAPTGHLRPGDSAIVAGAREVLDRLIPRSP